VVRTGGPRGHGSGRAATKAAETERRAKIRTAALLRKKQVRVVIVASYRLRQRSLGPEGRRRSELAGWTYQVGRQYQIRIDPAIARDSLALETLLNEKSPRRMHWNARVVQYL